ncbi:thiol-disulfide oxidoreductase DCC family protein [Fictibacillus aquaticus]|uniref:DUF393 domain-containing protein n=1 Tax=Fictibacillus aquaticus TaxID=2021314 RepID=A0A235F8H0_9BACL|nr:DUF393 domain-containing protein [Fictibacillus aquaticus]OYD57651.1 hypothetical protein CGZ90_13380 [Fictibacillus aquaticus]
MNRKNMTVFYDNWCPMCTGIKEKIEKLDWLHAIEFVGIREDQAPERIGVPLADLEKKMYAIIQHNGQIVSGLSAFTAISLRIPVWMAFYPFLKLSSALGIGHKVYDYIAQNRSIVPVNKCDTSCKIQR